MAKLLRAGFATVVLVCVYSCGSSTTSPTPTPTQASVTVSASPNPIAAQVCNPACTGSSGATFPFRITGNVNIQETAGVGGNVDFINMTFLKGAFVGNTTNDGADYIIQRLSTNHVAAHGSMSIPIGYLFRTGDGTTHITLNVSVHFTDDRGNAITSTVQWNVN